MISAMTSPPSHPVLPKPAASVVLVREAAPRAPIEVYLIRRQRGMKFLGGYYAFPGGRVDAADGAPETLARCRGLQAAEAAAAWDAGNDLAYPVPPVAYWVTAVRELVEETGLLLACDADGRAVDAGTPDVAAGIERVRKALVAGDAGFAGLLAREGWYADVRPLRYLSHFITPTSSPIRFSARFFLCPLPAGQAPRLYTEETSEGFWIAPDDGYRRFRTGEMSMAEPAEYGLGYVAQFASLGDLLAAHADGRLKFHGIIDRIDVFWKDFDWQAQRFTR
jgi:8-oxo-dGTP pyrophosphatase MutT (NUDIX family)